jgi:hypothetical protein
MMVVTGAAGLGSGVTRTGASASTETGGEGVLA